MNDRPETSTPIFFKRAGAVLWAALILFLLLLPAGDIPVIGFLPSSLPADKAIHAALFFIQAAAIWIALPTFRKFYSQKRIRALLTLIMSSGYGIITEFLQWAVTVDRHADVLDAASDITGASLFVAAAIILSLIRR